MKGPETLAEFSSHRTPDCKALLDPVMFEGAAGTLASGGFLSLQCVPGPLPVLGVGAALGWSRCLRRCNRSEGTPLEPSSSLEPTQESSS